jgi:hypothetical protein
MVIGVLKYVKGLLIWSYFDTRITTTSHPSKGGIAVKINKKI